MQLQRGFLWSAALSACVALARDGAAAWSMYNYDVEGTRYNAEEYILSPSNVDELAIKWVFPTPGPVTGTPAVLGTRLYAGDMSGAFYALDARTGDLVWRTQVVGAVTASALVSGRRVIFGDLAGYIYGLDRVTGEIVWQIRPNTHPLAQIYGSPTKIGRYVAIGVASIEAFAAADPSYPCCSARGSIVLLDPRDGRVVWQTYTISDVEASSGSSGASVWSTPTYDAELDLMYVTTGQNFSEPATSLSDAILALDPHTGDIVWANQRLPNDVWNIRYPLTPDRDLDIGDSAQVYTLATGQRVVGAGQKSGFYHVLDAATGAVVHQEQLGPPGSAGGLFSDSAVANGVVFANGSIWVEPEPPVQGYVVAVSGDASEELWRFTVPDTANLSGVAVANGAVYFASYDGNVFVLDEETGALLASVPVGIAASGPAVTGGHVYGGTGDPRAAFFGGSLPPGSIYALGLPRRRCRSAPH